MSCPRGWTGTFPNPPFVRADAKASAASFSKDGLANILIPVSTEKARKEVDCTRIHPADIRALASYLFGEVHRFWIIWICNRLKTLASEGGNRILNRLDLPIG